MTSGTNLAQEILASARYGDADCLRQEVAAATGAEIDFQDASGNSALHMACANGHVDCVRILIEHKASILENGNGNTPLHWAVQNKHLDVVKLLLEAYTDIDVLQQNKFGRGCVTEAFQSENTDIVALLLEHKSATEERLAGDSNSADITEEETKGEIQSHDDDNSQVRARVVQQTELVFQFHECLAQLKAREVALDWNEGAFKKNAEDDITGISPWSASLILSRWILDLKEDFRGKQVCELGSGCGVSGIASYLYTDASRVVLSDWNSYTVENLEHNASLNRIEADPSKVAQDDKLEGCHECGTIQRFSAENPEGKLMICARCQVVKYCSRECQKKAWKAHKKVCGLDSVTQKTKSLTIDQRVLDVQRIDWANEETWSNLGKMDVVIGADLVYHSDIVPVLAGAVDSLLGKGGKFLHVASQERDSIVEFKQAMEDRGFSCAILVAPESYKENPLVDRSQDFFHLHFNEMQDTYCLYSFVKK